MSPERAYESVNPIQSLRAWQAEMTAAQAQQLEAAKAAFFVAPADELCERAARLLAEPLSPHLPRTIALIWLINQELTRRGIGPRWRGLPQYVDEAPPPPVPAAALAPDACRPISIATRRRRMLRWIDLDWLATALGPQHVPVHARWRDVFAMGLDEATAERIANSLQPPHKLSAMLGVKEPHSFTLTGLMTRDAAERLRTVQQRGAARVRAKLDAQRIQARRPLTAEQHAARLRWVQAIELADGSATQAARLYGWMTGNTTTRQTAHEMRQKLAKQLGLRTAAWC
jgi:hypothetical protein